MDISVNANMVFRPLTALTILSLGVSNSVLACVTLVLMRAALLFGVLGDMRATVFEVWSTEGKRPTRLLVR